MILVELKGTQYNFWVNPEHVIGVSPGSQGCCFVRMAGEDAPYEIAERAEGVVAKLTATNTPAQETK